MFGVMRALLHLQALKLISEQIVDRPVIEYRDRVVEKEKVEAVFMLRESLKQLTLLTSCTVQIVEKPVIEYRDRVVETERVVEVPVERIVERIVEVPVDRVVEKTVHVNVPGMTKKSLQEFGAGARSYSPMSRTRTCCGEGGDGRSGQTGDTTSSNARTAAIQSSAANPNRKARNRICSSDSGPAGATFAHI